MKRIDTLLLLVIAALVAVLLAFQLDEAHVRDLERKASVERTKSPARWEYKVMSIPGSVLEEGINVLGGEGWEVVSATASGTGREVILRRAVVAPEDLAKLNGAAEHFQKALEVAKSRSLDERTATLHVVSVRSAPRPDPAGGIRYDWTLVVRNDDGERRTVDAVIAFKDAQGFVVDTDSATQLAIEAHSENQASGSKLLDAARAARVSSTEAELQERH